MEKKRAIIIDDDTSVLVTLSKILALEGYVTDTAQSGKEAIEKSNEKRYDLAIIDFRLPDVEGTRLLTAMRERTPRMVKIILTGYPNAENQTDAEDRRADAFLVKPVRMPELLKTIRECMRLRDNPCVQEIANHVEKPVENVVAIGASAGGPKALEQVLSGIPKHQPAAFVVSQHMPNGFTKSLAQRLAMLSSLPVREAIPGDILREGEVLIAPGGFNMELASGGRVHLEKTDETPSPNIDAMMTTTARVYGSRVVGVLLTGMLKDGVRGLKTIKENGGLTMVQDEASSVVYGMPKAAWEAGAADISVNIAEMANQIVIALNKISRPRIEV
ncbi:MAG TPA: chemotaxis protein CheB [Terriglobales bacterium]|nr:chemotaxis protein CheB [Terriglobales bacterium]